MPITRPRPTRRSTATPRAQWTTRRPRRSLVPALAVCLGLLASVLALAQTPEARSAPIPAQYFRDEVVLDGLVLPTAMEFASDGRVFVAEKRGVVKSFASVTTTDPPTIVADLRTQTYNFWDRGLLGLALHPAFPASPYLYVAYTYDFDPAFPTDIPRWGTPGEDSDPCPTPPGPTAEGCVVTARVSRLTITAGQAVAEDVLVEDRCQQYPSHTIGDLAFGRDGLLHVGAGDGASFTFADYGQGAASGDPCGDPPFEGGSLRAQDVRTPGDPTTLSGTVIRIDPITGAAAPGNPFLGSGDPNRARVVAHGLRNAFRMTFRPGTDELYVASVGSGSREGVYLVADTDDATVENFGWPCYEGSIGKPAFLENPALTLCTSLAPSAVTTPIVEYAHSAPVATGDGCPTGSSSISGVAFYEEGSYPERFEGAMIIADYSRRCIWAIPADAQGRPEASRAELLVREAGYPVDLAIGPGGDVFYVDIADGSIHRLSYDDSNRAPVISLTTSSRVGPTPLTVTFDASASTDPDPGDTLTFAWDIDGDGLFGDATGATAVGTYSVAGLVEARVRVTDPDGATTIRSTFVSPGGTSVPPPTSGGWQRNGSAVADSCGLTLTPAEPLQAGSAFWPTPVPTESLWLSACAEIGGGSGADGLAIVLADPAAGATAIGAVGGGLGFSGIPGHAITLDTFRNAGDPATNFVGLVQWQPGVGTTLLSANTNVPALRPGPRQIDVLVRAGVLRVLVDGQTVLTRAVDLPPQALVGFSGATGGLTDVHRVCDVQITQIAARPGTLALVPSVVDYGDVPVNGNTTRSIELTNTGETPISVRSLVLPLTPFSVNSYVPVGRVILPGERIAQAIDFNPTSPGTTAGSFTVITDDGQGPVTAQLSGNGTASLLPLATITSPTPTTTWRVGDTITFTGAGTTSTGDPLPASTMTWDILLHHCDDIGNCHVHPVSTLPGVASGSFVAPDHEYPSYLELRLRVTDANGTSTATRQVQPATAELTFDTVPSGLSLAVGALPLQTTPFTATAIIGSQLTVTAPTLQSSPAGDAAFRSWSDGGTSSHSVTVPATATQYTANYRLLGEPCGPTEVTSWTVNGAATTVANGVQLTPNATTVAGTAIASTPLPSNNLRICFDATITPGGADGMTLMLLDPSAGPTALGRAGGGLGFAGLPGTAIALDTYKNGSDPNGNFVALLTGSGSGAGPTTVATNTDVPILDTGTPRTVTVEITNGQLIATIDRRVVLNRTVALPPTVLVGLSAATGGLTATHTTTNIAVTTTAPRVLATPSQLTFPATETGTTASQTVTITNRTATATTIGAITTTGAGFGTPNPRTGTTLAPGATTTQTIAFAPALTGSVSGNVTIDLSGQPSLVIPVTGLATSNGSVCGPTEVTSWTVNGAATAVPGGVQLTPNTTNAAGTAIASAPLPSGNLRICFDATITPGGADGLTLMLLDPSAGPNALGGPGGGLGFAGLPGTAIALDTYKNGSDPTGNFLALLEGTSGSVPTTVATSTAIPTIDTGTPRAVIVEIAGGQLTVTFDGTLAMSRAVTLPPTVLVGLSAATGGLTAAHTATNIAVTTTTPVVAVTPTTVAFGATETGTTATRTVTITNRTNAPTTIGAITTTGTGFTTPDPRTGTTLNPGTSTTQTIAFAPTVAGPAGGTVTIALSGQPALTIPVTGTGTTGGSVCGLSEVTAWTTNGAATALPNGVQLTPNSTSVAGTAIAATPRPSSNLRICFDATITPGGADGMTVMLLDPSAGPTALGRPGGGLGFAGLLGTAIALDTFRNGTDPNGNFLALLTSAGGGAGPVTVATNTAIPVLDTGAPRTVVVEIVGGQLTVTIDGVVAMSRAITLPPSVLVGFSAATGGLTATHTATNIVVQTTPPPAS